MTARGVLMDATKSSSVLVGTSFGASSPAFAMNWSVFRGPVEHRDLKAMFGNIERKVATHGTETDQADFRGRAV